MSLLPDNILTKLSPRGSAIIGPICPKKSPLRSLFAHAGRSFREKKLNMTLAATQPNPKLPALRELGQLADVSPTIVIDTREQTPLCFRRLPSRQGTLQSGDYSIAGCEQLFAIERKTISDRVGCCTGESRARFERELHRLRGFRFRRLVIIGTELEIQQGVAFSRLSPKSVMGSLASFEIRYDLPVLFCATAERAAQQVETWAWYFAVEQVKTVNNLWRSLT